MPFDKTNGSDRTLLSEKAMSLTCSRAARLLCVLKIESYYFLALRCTQNLGISLLLGLKKIPPTLYCTSLYECISCHTEWKVFLKSTKHAYTLA